MPSTVRALLIPIFLAGAAVSSGAVEQGADAETGAVDPCCFTNPRYSGVCEVTPAADETCADVLAYLNNQASVGKTYCGNTRVRGGWDQVDCDDSGETASTTTDEGPRAEPRTERGLPLSPPARTDETPAPRRFP